MKIRVETIQDTNKVIKNPTSTDGFVVSDSMVPISIKNRKLYVPLHKIDGEMLRAAATAVDDIEKSDEACLIIICPQRCAIGFVSARHAADSVICA